MGSQDEVGGGAAPSGNANPDAKKDNIYENRPGSKKIIRVVTVMAYMVSVSFVAIVLSAYYVFLWQPPNPRLLHRAHLRADPQVEYLVYNPPTEVTVDDQLTSAEIRDRVNVFRDEILKNRERNVSARRKHRNMEEMSNNFNVSHENSKIYNTEIIQNYSRTLPTMWSPIVRALLATTETSVETENTSSTGVYNNINDDVSSETKSMETLTLFVETKRTNDSSSSTVASSSLADSVDKSNIRTISDFPSTSPATISNSVDLEPENSNGNFNYSSDNIKDHTERNIGPIISTEAAEFFERQQEVGLLDSIKSSGMDKPIVVDTIGAPGNIKKKFNILDAGTSGGSNYAGIRQEPDGSTTTVDNRNDVKQGNAKSNITLDTLGSHVGRTSVLSSTNDTEVGGKLGPNFQQDEEVAIEIVPDSAGDIETASNSLVSSIPSSVHQESNFIVEEHQETKEQLAQDGDFGFI